METVIILTFLTIMLSIILTSLQIWYASRQTSKTIEGIFNRPLARDKTKTFGEAVVNACEGIEKACKGIEELLKRGK